MEKIPISKKSNQAPICVKVKKICILKRPGSCQTVSDVFNKFYLSPEEHGVLHCKRDPGRDEAGYLCFTSTDPASCPFLCLMNRCGLISSCDAGCFSPSEASRSWLDVIPENGLTQDGIHFEVLDQLEFDGRVTLLTSCKRPGKDPVKINLWYDLVHHPSSLESVVQATVALYILFGSPLANRPIVEVGESVFGGPSFTDMVSGWSLSLPTRPADLQYYIGPHSGVLLSYEGRSVRIPFGPTNTTIETLQVPTLQDPLITRRRAKLTFSLESLIAAAIGRLSLSYGDSPTNAPRARQLANLSFAAGAASSVDRETYTERATSYGLAADGLAEDTPLAAAELVAQRTGELIFSSSHMVEQTAQVALAAETASSRTVTSLAPLRIPPFIPEEPATPLGGTRLSVTPLSSS